MRIHLVPIHKRILNAKEYADRTGNDIDHISLTKGEWKELIRWRRCEYPFMAECLDDYLFVFGIKIVKEEDPCEPS